MENLVERAICVVRDHPAPAVPMSELTRLVRGSGVILSDAVIAQTIIAGADHFRVIDPWRGPWHHVLERGLAAEPPDGGPERGLRIGDRIAIGSPQCLASSGWRGPMARLRATVAYLGWAADVHSTVELSRWCVLFLSAERFRLRVEAERHAKRRRNAPEVQPSSRSI